MKQQRLMIVFHDMKLGGIQRKTIDIIKFLEKHSPNTKIQLCLRKKEGIFLDQIPPGIKVTSPTFHTSRYDMVWFILWMVKEIIKFNPSHILSFMDLSSIPTLLALNITFWKKPQVTIGEDILTSKYLTDVYGKKNALVRLKLIQKYYPKAHKILVQTNIQKKDLENILSTPHSSKIIASPNWLPLDFPPQKSKLQINLASDILFVGRIETQKNLPKFIDIIKTIIKNTPKIKSNIVGSGSEETKIKKLINSYHLQNNIQINPPTSSPQKYYQNSKIFLLTSDYEGFPLTLMEAISCGCHPVCQNLPEIKLFFDKYQNQILFNYPQEAVKIINNVLTSPLKQTHIINYYQNKLVSLQQKNITKYVKYCLSN